ncbi:MAG TPA: terminase small subunit [Burkholderiaceae bacterium]|nr:terminase small subunit [Burkholderiaceae bacterium]
MTTKSATRKGVEPQGEATPRGLTPKQLRFVDEYLVDLNAAGAARRAGYSVKTADKIGYENLRKPEIASAVEAKRKELAGTLGITRERVLREMAKLAFSDLRQLYNVDGSLKPPHEWSDDAAGAVAGIETVEEFAKNAKGQNELIGYVKKVKLWDKGKQVENLLKHLGMAEDKPVSTQTPVEQMAPVFDALAAKLEKYAQKTDANSRGA